MLVCFIYIGWCPLKISEFVFDSDYISLLLIHRYFTSDEGQWTKVLDRFINCTWLLRLSHNKKIESEYNITMVLIARCSQIPPTAPLNL